MPAGVHNITIDQGAVYNLNLVYKDALGVPINLTGYKARMQIKKRFSGDALVSLTSDDGDIVLGGALGSINAKITAEISGGLTIKQGVYDLELVPPSGEDDAFRLVQGVVIVNPEVTT